MSDVVASDNSTTTVTTTTPAPTRPSVRILSLRHVGTRVFMHYRVCVQGGGMARLTERDHKLRAQPAMHRFHVFVSSCNRYKHSWLLLKRYRSPGRLVVTLRAKSNGMVSPLAKRAIRIR